MPGKKRGKNSVVDSEGFSTVQLKKQRFDRSAVKAVRRGLSTAGDPGSGESEVNESVAPGTSQGNGRLTQVPDPALCRDEEMEGLDTPVSLCPFVVDLASPFGAMWKSEQNVLIALQSSHPGLDITRKRAANGQALLVPMSPAAAEALDNISSLRIPDPLDPSKVIRQAANFFQLAPKTKRLEAILDRVPTAIDMELLASTNSKILKATRLESSRGGRGRQETTSVKILWEGATLPKYLTIGILGRFPTRFFGPHCFGQLVRSDAGPSSRAPPGTSPARGGRHRGDRPLRRPVLPPGAPSSRGSPEGLLSWGGQHFLQHVVSGTCCYAQSPFEIVQQLVAPGSPPLGVETGSNRTHPEAR